MRLQQSGSILEASQGIGVIAKKNRRQNQSRADGSYQEAELRLIGGNAFSSPELPDLGMKRLYLQEGRFPTTYQGQPEACSLQPWEILSRMASSSGVWPLTL